MIRLASILLTLLMLFGDSDVGYKIKSVSFDYIVIGSTRKVRGDSFYSSEKIHWVNESQVMRVIDMETEDEFIMSQKILDVAERHTKADYRGLVTSLSTDLLSKETSRSKGGYYYFTYSDGGKERQVKVEKDMFMNGYPRKLALYYYNPETLGSEFLTADFRRFVDDLIITDQLVKRHISGVDYNTGEERTMKNDYMLMMHTYVDEDHRNIVCTYEDIKMFITLKY